MGRLIDADALIEDLKGSLFYSDAIPFVEDAPTAYDIENVQNETREYFKNKINNANTSKTTDGWDLVEFNADIHKIIGKGGVE